MINFFIYLAVIVCGASVLAIEIVGTRVIAPFYGASLYLWSALISVTLAALSVGYAVGGRWADRGASLSRFCAIIGIAGLWILFIPLVRSPMFAVAETMELRLAVLAIATVLFFPPLALLGMVSPYAIRMKVSSLEVVGRTAGNLYALSTVASVIAALATGFILIPNIGVTRLILLIGVALIATAILGLFSGRRWKQAISFTLLFAIIGTAALMAAPAETANPDIGVMAVEQSAYAEIRVVDQENIRFMLIDGGTHTIVDRNTGLSQFQYINVLDLAKGYFAAPGEILLVGLGGGSVVRNFRRDGWQVEAVEIDPAVTRTAREYFEFDDADAQVYEMDGRQYLITHDKKYDLIIMDAFGSSSIPFHLVTREAFALIRSRLTDDGIMAMNVESVGWHDELVASLAVTAQMEFMSVRVFPIAEPPDQLGNVIIMAANRDLDKRPELPIPLERFSYEYDQAHAWDNRFSVKSSEGLLLTDDLNPVDLMSERVNHIARKYLHNTVFQAPGVAW